MKVASASYLPPPRFGCAKVYVENLQRYPTKYPLITYSEHDWDWPGMVKLKGNPEDLKKSTFADGKTNPFAINNVLWLTGLRIAREQGFSHVLYLESDCRVGVKHWDEKVFDEYFSVGRALVAGGNLACYNPCNHSPESARRWAELVSRNTRRNVPIPTYGWLPAAQKAPSCVFPNGALAIYSIPWMEQLFDHLEDTMNVARLASAFDMVLGVRLFEKFAEDTYEVLAHLDSVFSGYGEILSTEEERMEWLRSGRYTAVHQVKSEATL